MIAIFRRGWINVLRSQFKHLVLYLMRLLKNYLPYHRYPMRLAVQLHLTRNELAWHLLRGLLSFTQENLLHQPTKMCNKQRLMMLKRSRTGHKLPYCPRPDACAWRPQQFLVQIVSTHASFSIPKLTRLQVSSRSSRRQNRHWKSSQKIHDP